MNAGVFEPFLDAEDLSACVEASECPADLDARSRPLGCAWPLWLEPAQSFEELFLTVRATPAGFRYGWIADNVLGLRWRLPDGRALDLGGRTVKNVTGFDLVRFLSGTRGRFGRPLRLVLRLRPTAPGGLTLRLSGPWEGLMALARAVRRDPWSHVLERCDLDARPGRPSVLVAFASEASLLPLFRARALAWARDHGLEASEEAGGAVGDPPQARPWARAQAPLDDCVGLARAWLEGQGGRVRAFLGQGTLQFEEPRDPREAERALRDLHGRLGALGGHCEHPRLEPDPSAPQARWERDLLARLEGEP